MIIEIKIPSPGESITTVELVRWLVDDEEIIYKNQDLAEIDSDKATITISSGDSGKIKILVPEGNTVAVGDVIANIDTAFAVENAAGENNDAKANNIIKNKTIPVPEKEKLIISPQAQRIIEENKIEIQDIDNKKHKRITRKDVLELISLKAGNESSYELKTNENQRTAEVIKMSSLRRKLADRLVAVKNQTAMLTTFNEVDMSGVIAVRNKFKEQYLTKYGVKLSFMSFFVKASCLALKNYPVCNAQLVDENLLFFNYIDICIAVSTSKGLMVPVLRDADKLSFSGIDLKIEELADKARNNKITIDEMTGGTFTISNGGVFGSLFSTPILNPPQCAILGMHNIVERPVAIKGKVEIKPMMYLALSYDHRIIDGRDSVGFLLSIKEAVENPELLFGGKSPEKNLFE